MTMAELKSYRELEKEIRAIEEEIARLEYPISGGGERIGSRPSGVSDPTRSAALSIIDEKRKLNALMDEYKAERQRIEDWIVGIDKPEIRSIVRYRFILGYRWATVSSIIYGSNASSNLAQINLTRFLNL